jgi:3-hydroxyacyl-[acyl-carrier-protein] dehydratase
MNEKLATAAPPAEVQSYDLERIIAAIPHRYPFLMVDRMLEVVADERAVGLKNVSANEWYFQGHFPRRPVMPGVLIVEAMAQTAAVLVVHTLGPDAAGKLVYFMSIDSARFRRPVVPGDQLRLAVRKKQRRLSVWKFEAEATVEGRTVADATFGAMIIEDS